MLYFGPRQQAVELGIILLAAGVAAAAALRQAPLAPVTTLPRWAEFVGVALVLVVAVFFRINLIAVAPEGVWFDEAQNGLVAQRILHDPAYRPVFVAELTQLPALMFYLQALAIWLLGPDIVTLRLVSTVIGLAAVAGVYALGRLLFGVPVAIVAALLLAVERWHVNFSRFAMNGILVPTLTLGALYFAMRGLRSGRWRDLALAGVFLGLGVYSYPAFYVVPLILGIPLLVAFAAGPRQFIQRQWRGLAALAVVALVIAAPLIRYSFVDSGAFNQRVATTSVLTGKSPAEARDALLENIRRHLLMFHVKGDPNGRHNLPGAPMLDPVTGGLFALGLVFAISRARRPEYALLVGWLALALLPPVLSLDFEAPQAYRGIGVTPVAALLAALGAGWLFSRAWEWRRRWQVGLAALPAVALGCAVVANFDLYFNKQLTDFSAWAAYSTPETLMARTIMTLPAGTRVYASEFSAGQPTMRFLLGDRRDILPFDAQKHLPVRGDQPTALLLNPELDRQQNRIRALYPGARIVDRHGPSGGPSILTVIQLGRDQIVAPQGIQAAYYPGLLDEIQGEPAVTRKEAGLDATWEGGPPLSPPFTAVWRGALIAPTYGKYRFRLEGPPGSVLKLDEAETRQRRPGRRGGDARPGEPQPAPAGARRGGRAGPAALAAAGRQRLAAGRARCPVRRAGDQRRPARRLLPERHLERRADVGAHRSRAQLPLPQHAVAAPVVGRVDRAHPHPDRGHLSIRDAVHRSFLALHRRPTRRRQLGGQGQIRGSADHADRRAARHPGAFRRRDQPPPP